MRVINFSNNLARISASFILATVVGLLAGCTGTSITPSAATTTGTTVATASSLQLSGLPATVKSDNSTSSTITILAVSSTNSTVPGVVVNLSADTGLLSSASVITDATGKATVTFTSGTANKANRTATITATSGASTALMPVQVVGSTVALNATATSVAVGGSTTLTVTAKDAGGSPISGAAVTLSQTGGGSVTFTPATGTTDINGQMVVTVAGAVAGTATVVASAAGATSSTNFTVGAGATTFGINLLTLNGGTGVVPVSPKNTAMQIGDSLVVQVAAPVPTLKVVFATTIGIWNGVANQNVVTVAVVNGIAQATLTTSVAGVANVQVFDPLSPALSDTLTVGMTAKTAAKISLQATPTVVPRSVGSTVGYSNLTAMVYDTTGAPVGNAPVAFSIVSGTGTNSGETVSPVVVFSAASTQGGLPLGAAPATFTSGSLSSGAAGVQVRASVVGTAIATQSLLVANTTASSYDAAIIVGGTAGSIAFGQASKIIDAGGASTIYSMPMSVLVADSNGSPAPAGTVVNISTWPIAWSTGSGCKWDLDGGYWTNATPPVWVPANMGTYYNEDANQNLFLDLGEDGTRKYFATGTVATPLAGTAVTLDGQITPLNSYGGTLASTNPADKPGTATTDATGLATFNLTYTKSSANWIISRIHASASVQGTPAVGQLDFRLVASVADSVPCVLPPSPFKY
ncbi:MAG: Ig-like domain-containing protein [Nitrosomonadales bacterium]|nr:Ig-like domain-containing protein [Nitrosomonadales bacterium]